MSQSSSAPRRRFLYQFSLRTLLLATAAVAVFCNWYFQPKYNEEELAGKALRLRRQIKDVTPQTNEFPTSMGPILSTRTAPMRSLTADPSILNHGNWSLLDGDDFTLTRGRFIENQATGNWTAWYPTGGKAAEGKMQQGVKVGPWRTWYEGGTLASEVHFADKPAKSDVDSRQHDSGFGQPLVWPPRTVQSSRKGPAKVWYENGKLRYEGRFALDRQDGIWTFYDEQGRVTETGPFRAGQRHGQWTLTRSVSEGGPSQTQTIHYIDGRTQAELDDLLGRLQPMLASDSRKRYAALIDLTDIGEGAVPLLAERLSHGDSHEQAAIVGMIPRMPTGAHLLLPRVRELLASGEPRVAHQARLTLYQLNHESRGKLFEPLLAEAIAAPSLGLCLEELVALYQGDESFRGRVFAALMELPTTREDSDAGRVAEEAAGLRGDVTEFVRAACDHSQWQVRLQTVHTIGRLRGWAFGPHSRLSKEVMDELLAKLQHDASPEVRLAAEALAAPPVYGGPSGSWGVGSGFTGNGSF